MQPSKKHRAKENTQEQRFLEITQFEKAARAQGHRFIAGVDEAGRGPLAGPVVAAACILPEELRIDEIDDSKRLSQDQREKIFALLTSHPQVDFGIGIIEAWMIDQINILQATLQAMAAAIVQLKRAPDFILIDGKQVPPVTIPCQPIIQGDRFSQSIMAAAVLAKVTRDRQMVEYAKQFPEYGFSSNKGYPTQAHLAALQRYGPCTLHRRSYAPVRNLLSPSVPH